jgi:4-amino-4-deoxy-L-arabinose transferase-like glycosyltransferase
VSSRRWWIFLGVIVFFAAAVRFIGIGQFPPLLTQDEASLAYNAWSIARTGRDEWGQKFPLVFSAFGDAKQPVYIYLASLGYKIFGWRADEIRWLSALAGTLSVGLASVWIWLKTRDRSWALAAGAITAFAPWMVHLSRMALESNLALMFFLLGLSTWELAKETRLKTSFRRILWTVTAVSWSLASYAYIAYRLFVVIWVAILFLARLVDRERQKINAGPIWLLVLTFALVLPGFILGGSGARLGQIGIFRPEVSRAPQTEWRNNCHLVQATYPLPGLRYVCAALWNPVTVPSILIGRSWLDHLGPQFLFFSGDLERYRNPLQTGALFAFLLPLYGVGLLVAARDWRRHGPVLLGWVLSVLPSVLTAEPQAFRLTPHYPFALLLIALGGPAAAKYLSPSLRPKLPLAAAGLAFFLFLTAVPLYLANTYGHSQNWLSQGQEIGIQTERLRQQGYTVFVDDVIPEPHIFWAFWNQIPPETYQSLDLKPATDQLGFRRPSAIGSNIILGKIKPAQFFELICQPAAAKSALITAESSLKEFTPSLEIRNQNGEHVMASIYDLELMRSEPVWKQYCQVRP